MAEARRPTILVTGATGFIGRHALDSLLERDFEVHAIFHQRAPDNPRVTWHQADVLDARNARAVCSKLRPSHLLHFAWYTSHGSFWHSDANARWLEAGDALCREFLEHGGRRIIGVGSCAEYDVSDSPCTEFGTPLTSSTAYSKAKNQLRLQIAASTERAGATYAWARIFHLFGPDEHPDRIVPALIRAALAHAVVDCASGDQIRDFLHVTDVADACAAITGNEVTGPVNVGSGQPLRLRDLAGVVERVTGAKRIARFNARPARAVDPVVLIPDVTRLREEVGWIPRASLQDRVSDMVDWWRQQLAIEPLGVGGGSRG